MSSFYFQSYNGWICSRCHAWVPNSSTHACPTTTVWVNPPPPPAPHEFARIAAALERIAAAFEQKDTRPEPVDPRNQHGDEAA